MNQSPIYKQSSIGRMPINHNRDNDFSLEVHVFRHATSLLCQPTLGGSVAKRCSTNLVLNRTPQEPTHNWGNSMTRAIHWSYISALRRGRYKTPYNHREMAMNNHQLVPILLRCSKLSRWRQPPRVTRKPQLERSPSATRCNHSSKCTWNHFQSMKEMSGRCLLPITQDV